jgi:hypothetical protein
MLDADEVVELRELERRAYGRGGGLTAAEAARLDELRVRRGSVFRRPHQDLPAPLRTVRPADPLRDEHHVVPPDTRGADGVPVAADAVAAQEPERVPGLPTPSSRVPWRAWAGVAAAALALGLGTGWLLFHPTDIPGVPLTSEQQRWQDAFASDEGYDRGSVRAVTVVDDVVVWVGTKEQGEWTCLVLGDGTSTSPACNPTESVRTSGLYASLTSYVSEGRMRQVSANLHLAADGSPAVVTNTAQYSPSTTTGWASAREEAMAENLTRLGFDPFSVWIAGYDGEVAVWVGVKAAAGQTCLIRDGSGDDPEMACEPLEAENSGRSEITLVHVDPETGARSSLVYTFGPGAPYLTITREQGSQGEVDD